jgi:hypothetical protein
MAPEIIYGGNRYDAKVRAALALPLPTSDAAAVALVCERLWFAVQNTSVAQPSFGSDSETSFFQAQTEPLEFDSSLMH